MTAASPMTMVPMPIEMSAPPWVCANSAPASATSAFDSAMPARIMAPVLTPWARAMRPLEPVERMARPAWVARNQSSASLTMMTTTRRISGRAT
ncbi:Uncharacterised protein [Bordetella pertussis]|nr:Uncharacterised protein [Bordetella pertussis]